MCGTYISGNKKRTLYNSTCLFLYVMIRTHKKSVVSSNRQFITISMFNIPTINHIYFTLSLQCITSVLNIFFHYWILDLQFSSSSKLLTRGLVFGKNIALTGSISCEEREWLSKSQFMFLPTAEVKSILIGSKLILQYVIVFNLSLYPGWRTQLITQHRWIFIV